MDQKDTPTGREHRLKRTVAKYAAKTFPDGASGKAAAKARLMTERYQEQAEVVSLVHEAVRSITNPAGIPGWSLMWYYCYGRQVYRLWRTTPPSSLPTELRAVRYKWVTRSLDPRLLCEVEAVVIAALEKAKVPRPRLDWLTGAQPKVD